MQKVLLIGLLVLIGLTSFQKESSGELEEYNSETQYRFSGGIFDGATGAPGEVLCTHCHVGTVQNGDVQHLFTVSQGGNIVSDYVPGQSYDVRLELNSGDVLEGFQATVLDLLNDEMAGTFTSSNSGTAIIQPNPDNRQYANQTFSSNAEGNPAWEWQWSAPSTDLGPVRFYVASNLADGASGPDNDVIYSSQYTFGGPASLDETVDNITNFEVGYMAENNILHLKFNTKLVDVMFLNLVDINGKSIVTRMLSNPVSGDNTEEIRLPSGLDSGLYIVHFFVGNTSISSKVRILSK